MKKKNRGILLIFVLFIILFFVNILEANGATYTSKSSANPGYKFEEDASWTGGSKPGTYSAGTFTVSANSNITINGLVYLNGNLDMKEESTIKVSDNSTLIISGNFDISDKSKITIGNSASVYVKGNFTTYDMLHDFIIYHESNHYVYVEMDKFSNLAVEGNFTSTSDANVEFVASNGRGWGNGNAPDFYVFGDWSGTAYTAIQGLDRVEDEESFERNESTLNNTVVKATANLDNCAMTIPANTSYVVGVDEEIYVTALTMNANSTLVNNGKIHFVKSCADHTLADFDFASTCFYDGVNLTNNGEIHCKNYNQRINQNTWWANPVIIYNHGLFECTETFDANYSVRTQFESSCNSAIKAKNINIYSYGNGYELNLNGVYKANEIYILRNDGNNAVNFGADCGTSEVVTNKLTLEVNNGTINVRELTNVSEIHLIQSAKFSVDGTLILGNVTKQENWMGFGVSAGTDSKISFCYNPTHNADFGGNGQSVTTQGQVIYRYDSNDDEHSWYTNGDDNNPSIENDIICNDCRMIANAVNFDDCMNGVSNFLPIELISFNFDKSSNEFIWTTASETNNDYFVVEYSSNGTTWCECTSHMPSLSNTGWTYECTIPESTKGSQFSYYRLKQVDFDGKYSYSDILSTSWKVQTPQYQGREYSKAYITSDGKILYNYDQLPSGTYIEKSENGIRKIVKIK